MTDVARLPAVRTCANCACFGRMGSDGSMVETEADSTPVCRRNPPGAREQRVEVPYIDPATNAPVMDRGRTRMVAQKVLVIGYPATVPAAVCFDGWRPPGTLPGVKWEAQRLAEALVPFLEKALIQTGVAKKAAEEMGLALLTGLMPARE
jgi:hypothetical protein